jgi:hypothetical protein
MSVRLSKIKVSKAIVVTYLTEKYPQAKVDAFYTKGTEEKGYDDQFLRIETDYKDKDEMLAAARKFLTDVDKEYEKLDLRIGKLKQL